MSIIINIKPEAEAELTRQAKVHGVRPEAYAATLLEEAVHNGRLRQDLLRRLRADPARWRPARPPQGLLLSGPGFFVRLYSPGQI